MTDREAAVFDAEGSLRELRDAQGHYLEFSYEGDPSPARQDPIGISPYSPTPYQTGLVARVYQLTRIEEFLSDGTATGRYVTLEYDETTEDTRGRLTSIESFDGRTVLYGRCARLWISFRSRGPRVGACALLRVCAQMLFLA